MSEKDKQPHNSDADRGDKGLERIDDPLAALDRLRRALKGILKVPKSEPDPTKAE